MKGKILKPHHNIQQPANYISKLILSAIMANILFLKPFISILQQLCKHLKCFTSVNGSDLVNENFYLISFSFYG